VDRHQRQHDETKKRPKIMCIIYTIASGHQRVQGIRETWGYVALVCNYWLEQKWQRE
jgi:hypothetical protein